MPDGSKRREFLEVFFKLFDVEELIISDVSDEQIKGTVVYDSTDQYERQDFCLHMSEEEVPSKKVQELLQVIFKHKFINGDKILVSEETLFKAAGWQDRTAFDEALSSIYEIEVNMVDDGVEADSFFLHN